MILTYLNFILNQIGSFLSKLVVRSEPEMSSPAVISWLKWLELHPLAAHTQNQLNQTTSKCNSSSVKSSAFAFKMVLEPTEVGSLNWLYDIVVSSWSEQMIRKTSEATLNLGQNIANFIHFGLVFKRLHFITINLCRVIKLTENFDKPSS